MVKLICDACGKEIDQYENYDEDGYSQFVNIEVRNSRTFGGEYDLCNDCYVRSLKHLRQKEA